MLVPVSQQNNWKKKAVWSSLLELGRDTSMVLNSSAKRHNWKGKGPLSLKLYRKGQAEFQVENNTFLLDERSYLVLNDEEPYEVTIDEEENVEAFCIFFQRDLLPELISSCNSTDAQRLDQPHSAQPAAYSFPRHTFRQSERFNRHMSALGTALDSGADPLMLETGIRNLLEYLVWRAGDLRQREDRLEFIKPSTRSELIERVLTARDYIHSHYRDNITLEDISRASSLSANHLLRTFKQVFRQTPNRYVMQLRMEKAAHLLLENPEKRVSQVCFESGYESVGYFTTRFKEYAGCTPSGYRSRARLHSRSTTVPARKK